MTTDGSPPLPTSGRGRVEMLQPRLDSLALPGPSRDRAGTLYVLGPHGGVRVEPVDGTTVVFGRDASSVHVVIGIDDVGVSQQHGSISYNGRRWHMSNQGLRPIRLPESELLHPGEDWPLPSGYTPVFIRTGGGREHLVEIRVAASRSSRARQASGNTTQTKARAAPWELSDTERIVLTVLAQRYLRHEPNPQPLSWSTVASELQELQPEEHWTSKRAEHRVAAVRGRLAAAEVRGLARQEVSEPIGNALNHNLIMELLRTGTLVPTDLWLLGP